MQRNAKFPPPCGPSPQARQKCRNAWVNCRATIRKCRAAVPIRRGRVLLCRVLPRCLGSRFLRDGGVYPGRRVLPRCLVSLSSFDGGIYPGCGKVPRCLVSHPSSDRGVYPPSCQLVFDERVLPRYTLSHPRFTGVFTPVAAPPRRIRASLGLAVLYPRCHATPSPLSPQSAAERGFANRRATRRKQPTAPLAPSLKRP